MNFMALVDTVPHSVSIVTQASSRIIGNDIFKIHSLNSFVDPLDEARIISQAEISFETQADRDSLVDFLKDTFQNHTQIKKWIKSVLVTWHDCSHYDADIKNCRTTNYLEWGLNV